MEGEPKKQPQSQLAELLAKIITGNQEILSALERNAALGERGRESLTENQKKLDQQIVQLSSLVQSSANATQRQQQEAADLFSQKKEEIRSVEMSLSEKDRKQLDKTERLFKQWWYCRLPIFSTVQK